MRKCFIHIGAHKTGTTSIQHLLSRNSSALQERGYFYPQAGRLELLPGHHNLAWEISGHGSFQNQYGTIDDLMREVKHRSEDVILSSEELHCSLHNRAANFSDFVSLLQSCGFLVTVILYLRNQIDSLSRMYLSLITCGSGLGFDDVLRQTLDTGSFHWQRSMYNFDYCDVITRIGQIANVNVVVRSYEQSRTAICSDFLSIFNLTLRDLQVDDEILANESLRVRDYLQMFLQNRMGRTLLENEVRAVNSLVSQEGNEIELSPVVRSDLFQRFRDTNRDLFIQYGIPEPKMENTNGVLDYPDKPYIDKLFSEGIEACLLQTLSTQLAEKDGEVQTLSTQLAEQTRALQKAERAEERVGVLSAQLLNTETQLKSMRETFGWRLLSQYVRIKYRFLLPVYRLFGQVSAERTETKPPSGKSQSAEEHLPGGS